LHLRCPFSLKRTEHPRDSRRRAPTDAIVLFDARGSPAKWAVVQLYTRDAFGDCQFNLYLSQSSSEDR